MFEGVGSSVRLYVNPPPVFVDVYSLTVLEGVGFALDLILIH